MLLKVSQSALAPKLGAKRNGPAVARPAAVRRSMRGGRRVAPSTIVSASATGTEQDRAEARWKNQVQDGTVRYVNSAQELTEMRNEGWVLLDVRPPNETTKVGIQGAVEVPLFRPDEEQSFSSAIKHATFFGMGGWWLGGCHMVPNMSFLADVQANIPKDANIVVGCQAGLRSLAACEQLSRAGYKNLAWINGGFDMCKKELATTNGTDIRYAGIGGLSEALGWTTVQVEENKEKFGGSMGIIKFAAAVLLADTLWAGYTYYQIYQETGQLPSFFGLGTLMFSELLQQLQQQL